ncbi:MAG: ferredoxin [Nocardioides sp.]
MRLQVDQARCEGHGLCENAAPGLLHLDDDLQVVIDKAELDAADEEAAYRAEEVCPVQALWVTAD